MIKETTDSRLIKRYFKLLRELNGLRLSRFPGELLPAPKNAIKEALTSEMERNTEEKERLEVAVSTLDMFEERTGALSDFTAKLITVPTIITLIYTIWLGFTGESWLWTINIVLIPLAVGGVLVWRYGVGWPKNFLKRQIYFLLEIITLGSIGIVTLKLAFLSGFWGLIQSVGKIDWVGIILALTAIFLGYHMCKCTNRLFFFLANK